MMYAEYFSRIHYVTILEIAGARSLMTALVSKKEGNTLGTFIAEVSISAKPHSGGDPAAGSKSVFRNIEIGP